MTLSNRKILRTLFRLLAGILYAVCLSACDAKEPLPENRDAEIESPVIANDLSNQKVTAIAEDTQGHIWIGTFRGLNKNNVHDYHQYFCTDDSLGLPDNQITHLLRDSKNRFWVGTVNGVCLYTDKDNFRIIPIEADNKNVRQILEDRNGRIFLSTGFQLYAYHPREEKITCVLPEICTGNTFYAQCHIAPDNNLWVMTSTGLRCYDLSTAAERVCRPQRLSLLLVPAQQRAVDNRQPHPQHLRHPHAQLQAVAAAHRPKHHAVQRRHRLHTPLRQQRPAAEHRQTRHVLLQPGHRQRDPPGRERIPLRDAPLPNQPDVHRLAAEPLDSSVDQGYTVCYHYKERFNNDNYLRSELNNKSVVSLSAGKDHKLWISTLMDGIYVYDTKSSEIRHIDPETFWGQEKQKAIYVNQLMVDSDNNLWMTSTDSEVLKARYTPDGQLKIEERHRIFLPMSIAQSPDGTIWIAPPRSTSMPCAPARRNSRR